MMHSSEPKAPAAFPTFFILGAAKSGTTSLYQWLRQHSQICMSVPKEPFFFESEFTQGVSFYRSKYFKHWRGEPVVGEARHRNLYLHFVPERIHQTHPQASFIITLRNPVNRAHSHWWHWYRTGEERLCFEDALAADLSRINAGHTISSPKEVAYYQKRLDRKGRGPYRTYLDTGYYDIQIERYLQFFPRDRFLVLFFEELADAPARVMARVCRFLRVDPTEAEKIHYGYENPAKQIRVDRAVKRTIQNALQAVVCKKTLPSASSILVPRRRKEMLPETREWLYRHYRPHNDRLAAILGSPIPCWCPDGHRR